MIDLKVLIISILIPNIAGFIGSFLGNFSKSFDNIVKPSFMPPSIVFPIVWIILYTLMGISSYIVFMSKDKNKKPALIFYLIQLLLNILWPFFFFNLHWFLFSFIWLLLILIFTIIMCIYFFKINKLAGYLQLPYILWLIFAGILNFSVFLLN